MQNLLGKMADMMGSLLTGSSPQPPQNVKAEERKKLVVDYRSRCTTAILKGADGTDIIKGLAGMDCPLREKYAILPVAELLTANNQSVESLNHIVTGLPVIIKYAQHLVRKSEERNEQWRVIPLTNSMVQRKLKPMKKFEVVLQLLGYTGSTPSGLCFPAKEEPNVRLVVNLITDMMLFRRELKDYLQGRHPYPQHIQEFIPTETRQELQLYLSSGAKCDDDEFSETSSQMSVLLDDQTRLSTRSPDQNRLSPQSTGQNRLSPQLPVQILTGGGGDARLKPEPQNDSAKPEGRSSQNHNNNNNKTAIIPEDHVLLPSSATAPKNSGDCSRSNATPTTPSHAGGLQEGMTHAPERLVKVESERAIQDLVNSADQEETSTLESSSSVNTSFKLACTVCGDEAVVYCLDCSNKALCEGCNSSWHKHPTRQGHRQSSIIGLAQLSPESLDPVLIDGTYGISAQSAAARLNHQKQQTYLVNSRKALRNTPVRDKAFLTTGPHSIFHGQDSEPMPTFPGTDPLQRNVSQQPSRFYQPEYMMPGTLPPAYYQQQQQYPYQQHQMLAASQYELHPYESQLPFNSRQVYSDSNIHSHMIHQGHPIRPGPEAFNTNRKPYQQLDPANYVDNYVEPALQQPHPVFYTKYHSQAPQVRQQPSDLYTHDFPSAGPPNVHAQNPSLAHIPQLDNMGNVLLASNKIMPNGRLNPQNTATDFTFQRQQMMRSNSGPLASQMFIGQHSLMPGNLDSHIHAQNSLSPVYPQTGLYDVGMTGAFEGMMGSHNQLYQRAVPQVTPQLPQVMSQSMHHLAAPAGYNTAAVKQDNFRRGQSLLDQLTQIRDTRSRLAKCDELIEKLTDDLSAVEHQMNSAMEIDVNAYYTAEFKAWNVEKATLRQLKKSLEDYRITFENETVMKMTEDEETIAAQEIYYPPPIDLGSRPAERMSKKPVEMGNNISVVTGHFEGSGVADDYDPRLYTTNQSMAAAPYVHEASRPRTEQSQFNNTTLGRHMLKTLPTGSNSLVTDPPSSMTDSRRMTLTEAGMPTVASLASAGTVSRCAPGTANDTELFSSNVPLASSSQKTENILDRIIPAPKVVEVDQLRSWHCQHCTYINEPHAHICAMCEKTSDQPVLSSPQNRSINQESEDSFMKPDAFLDMLREIQESEKLEQQKRRASEERNSEGQALFTINPKNLIGSKIAESQDQVMLEKKKAQEKYEQQQIKQSNTRNQTSEMLPQSAKSSPSPPPHGTRKTIHSPEQGSLPSHLGSLSLSEYHTPPTSEASSPSPVPAAPSPVSPRKKISSDQPRPEHVRSENTISNDPSAESRLEQALARFNETKMIETLRAQGAEFTKLIKMADREGFTIEAVQIAQTFCDGQDLDPLVWLKTHWQKNINMVMSMAVSSGNKLAQNSVGEVSPEEAESAYVSCWGNVKEAAQTCVDRRTQLYEQLSALGDFPREEILQVMFQCQGNQAAAEQTLIESRLEPFYEHIWAEKDNDARSRFAIDFSGAPPEMCHSFSTSIIFHDDFQRIMKDTNVNRERRIRMIFVEGKLRSWGRAELVIKILDNDLPEEDISLEDVVEAVRNCQDRTSALAYLQQECALCFTNFPMSKIRSLNFCQCKMCEQCLTKNFEIGIKEKHVRHWNCPLCLQPDINDEFATNYLQFLSLLLQPLIERDLMNVFEVKIRDWHLQKDPNFRWCAHCAEGFLAEDQGGNLRMTCPHCQEKTCFQCKRQWEPQHEGLTCQQFAQWKIDNDPTNQSVGLAKHLDENGIDCPTCKMRFALAKGGCMHFKCPQCGHEFCSGCNEPFHQKDVCTKYKICRKLGLHCHCPRDCFSYLRDNSVQQLQQLLKMHNVAFNTHTPEDQTDPLHCPVIEQKEFDADKKDEKCGKETQKGQAGLCETHYKEYLVCLINRHELDPVVIMARDEMTTLLGRYDLPVPKQKSKDSDEEYVASLMKVIKEKLPLRRR